MPKKITMYTTTTCAYCVMVKKWLTSKNLQYEEINLDEKPELRAEVTRLSGGMTVPVTVVTKADDTQDVIVGWNLAKLAPAVS